MNGNWKASKLLLQLAPNLYPCDWMAFRACTFIRCGHDLSVLRQDDVTSCYAPVALGVNKVMNRRTNKLQGDSIIRVTVVRHFPGASVSRYCESAYRRTGRLDRHAIPGALLRLQ